VTETRVAIALGSNLGDREASLRGAADALGAFIDRLTLSSFIETAPVGVVEPQPWYLNAAAVGTTSLRPCALLEQLLAVERAYGRARTAPNAARTLDLDLMIVIGGYNSSNTCNLAHICADQVPTYHIADPDCLVSTGAIRHKPVGQKHEEETAGWLAEAGPITLGLTSGASTPDNLVEQVVRRLETFANADPHP